ncbi:MAG: ABC transporter ATP-binding protein, partial [Cyclobacteriaceae bacterium]
SDQTAKEIKIFGLANFLTDRFKILADNYFLANKKLATRRAGWGSVLSALGTAGYYVAYVFIVIQTINGLITLGTLTFLAGSFLRMRNLLESMMMRFNTMAEGALYLQDFFDFFDIKPQIAKKEKVKSFPRPIKQGFVFENLGFQYAGTDFWAVRNLNFSLLKGEKLALVGENGAGKTTLVKLLARLYDPTEGRILLDGFDLREYDPEDLRQEIGVIFQDFVKYQFKFGENIGVGNITERENQQRIENSAAMSMADSVVKQLPHGYEQMIGRRFANGVELSGGQWQKIALGRVYMSDAQLLILDEPTAALDARAEHEVFQRFADLSKDKTAVLISHRFSTVRMADRILVLQNGRMAELGSHRELLAQGGKYAELFNLQAKGYM